MREDFVKLYEKFIDAWGLDSQILMCIEEMSELTKELCKYSRYLGTDKESLVVNNIKEELGDVANTIEQLTHYFGEEDIMKIREYKMNRASLSLKNNNDSVSN